MLKNVIRYWLNKGVDGFRMDAIPFLFENADLLDEAPSGYPNTMPGDHGNLIHNLTQNLPETYDMIAQWRSVVDAKKAEDNITRLMKIEAYASLEQKMDYYGNESTPAGHFPFNFLFITNLNNQSTAHDFRNTVNQWMQFLEIQLAHSKKCIGNHDQHRVASRYGPDLVDGLNMLALLLPGSAITYNGEEIGMEDGFVSWKETKDPQGINAGEDRYLVLSRDPERTPFQWDDSVSAGFSTNSTTWLPVSSNYRTLNLQNQISASKSHYKVYKKLLKSRQTPTIQRGNLTAAAVSENVFAFTR
ncbi:Maltase 2 [Blattella germanica]|nr:Maltase 2 [Blattella germanica]